MPTGLTKDAGWEIGVSRTLPVTVDEAWERMTSPSALDVWLGEGARLPDEVGAEIRSNDGGVGELRSHHPRDRVRLRWRPAGWDHDTTLQVAVSPAVGGTTVRFHQEHLASALEREHQRDHWRAILARLEPVLTGGRATS